MAKEAPFSEFGGNDWHRLPGDGALQGLANREDMIRDRHDDRAMEKFDGHALRWLEHRLSQLEAKTNTYRVTIDRSLPAEQALTSGQLTVELDLLRCADTHYPPIDREATRADLTIWENGSPSRWWKLMSRWKLQGLRATDLRGGAAFGAQHSGDLPDIWIPQRPSCLDPTGSYRLPYLRRNDEACELKLAAVHYRHVFSEGEKFLLERMPKDSRLSFPLGAGPHE